jgi:DNA repair photolyase
LRREAGGEEVKRKTGWNEWSDKRLSLFTGCVHSCRYCFARYDAVCRYHRVKDAAAWAHPVEQKFDPAKWRRKYAGTVACFGTHDITPAILPQCAAALETLLQAGNKTLIVTKPHVECVEHLCKRLHAYRGQVEWRFTIGAEDDALLSYWEPGAPRFDERMDAAGLACSNDYDVSFSVEPMLDPPNVFRLLGELRPFAKSIWIGKLNDIARRVRPFIVTAEDRRQVERIETLQEDPIILVIVAALKGDR